MLADWKIHADVYIYDCSPVVPDVCRLSEDDMSVSETLVSIPGEGHMQVPSM